MMGLGFRYLSSDNLQGFNRYKYSCIETNPISLYLFQPWWKTAVKAVPMWVAPNVLTLAGFILHLTIFFLFTYYDYDFTVTSNDEGINKDPIPTWVWFYAAIAHFLAHTLDGIDGKQARRTDSSSPVGELFDHGLDSMACFFIPLSLYCIVGRGSQWGTIPMNGYWCAAAIMGGYYISHWEKYITGTMYLPWAYDTGELAIMLVYLLTGVLGVNFWQFDLIPGWKSSRAFRYGIIVGFFLSLASSIINVRQSFTSSLDKYSTVSVTTTINQNSSTNTSTTPSSRSLFNLFLAPSLPIIVWFTLFTGWALYSPTGILSTDPRVFIATMGLVFSNISCRLIVSQMSGKDAEVFNYLFVPIAMAIIASFIQPEYELTILYWLVLMVLIAHVHYGCSIVYELCTHFNIYAFFLTKPFRD